ncbi:MAG TPA: JAB domain-containing protein [Anaerolineales bacterium]|nr:JAB domain-containing protein [Anaerolineales bacterium]
MIAYDDTGRVRGVRAISSRLPARSQAFATTNAGFALYDPATDRVVGIAKTRKRARAYINSVEGKRQGRLEIRPNTQLGTDDWQELRQWMQAIGAAQYALEHNHPSGNPTPSNDDVRMSQNFARELPGFQGHVVIDSGRYATISATGEVGMHDLPGDHSQDIYHPPPASLPEHMVAEDDTVVLPLTGINSPETIVQAAKGIMRQSATGPTDDQMVAVMYLNARPDMAGLEVRGMELVPEQTFHNERLMRMWLRQRTRHYGSKFTAAYYEGPVEAIHTAGDLLYQRGAINEFISGAQGTPALGSLKSFLPGLAGARSLEGVTPGFQVQEEEEVYGPLRLGEALPTTIEGVPVERVQKAVDEYMLLAGMADRTQTLGQLADATFARLKIKTATQLEIERNRLVRWLSLETAIPTLMKRAKTDPTFSMSAADIGAWKLFGEMLLDDINTKRLQGTLTPEHATTLQHEIYKTHGEVLTAGSSEAGRALKRMQQGGGPVMAFAEFMKRFKTRHPTASQEKLDAIGRKFTETFQQRGEPGLQELVLEELDPVALDYFWELYYGSILSGVPTHVVNTVGNLSYAVYHNGLVEGTMAALDWTIAGITGRQRTLYMRDVVAGMNAMWRSARPAYRDAWYWWKAPFPQAIGGAGGPVPFGAGIQRGAQMGGERQRHDWGAPAWAHATPESMPRFLPAHAKTALASWMRSFAPFIGAANRALNAADVAAKTLGGDATLAREASMEARRRFGANVTPEQEAAFLADVQAHLEQYPAIQAEVQRVGLDNTFNDAVSGIAQTVINARQWSQPFGFLARLTFPFAATPDRLIARGLELVPGVGFVVGTHEKGLRWNGFLPHLKAGDQAALEIAAKQLIGVALTMAAWWLWDQEKLTGTLSTNANERDSQLRRGLIPHAVILNGRAVEYRRFEPFHLPFGFVTTIFTAMRDLEHKRQREALEGIPAAEYVDDMMALAGLASSGMARFVLDSSYFSGLARFFQAVSPQGGSVGKGLSQQIASTVIPFVGLSRSVARALEASGVLPGTTAGEVAVREAAVPSQAILRNLPGAAVGVRERVDVFGRPVTTKTILGGPAAAGEVFFSPVRTAPVGQDAIDEDLARLRYFPQVPSKATLQQALHRRVSDEELQAFRLARGQLARQQLERLTQAAWFQDLPDERKRKRYQAVFRHATKQALRALQSPGSAQAVGLLEAG